ncbi:MAG: CCA tRNA nucleotidyltransferase [Candidatus Micrarchaeales archaeon]|jgi:tRNA nucleotidyltransferase (CCA-adding enzyme)
MKASTVRIAESIFSRVLEDIKPSDKELEESVYNINELTSRLNKVISNDVEIRVVGSIVKGTQLVGDSDVDMFLLFDKKHSREKITADGISYAKSIVKGKDERYEIKYAEHPYVRVYLDSLGVKADIVPAFKIDNIEDMGTAVDRSPMHADFINTHFSDKQRDDVRVLKYLLKAQGIYGAEVMTSGFSGYLCELLVYQCGSLLKLLEMASEIKPPILLDPRNKVAMRDPSLVKRFNSEFVVIDPIDKNRNVAAGVSVEALARFVVAAREFVRRPSIKLFYGKGFDSRKAKKLLDKFLEDSGLDLLMISISIPDKSEDIVWPQLRKVSELVTNHAERLGFGIYLTIPMIQDARGLIAFFAPKERIKSRILKGPSVFIGKAQREFSEAHKNAIGMLMKGEVMYALEKSEYEKLADLMKDIVTGNIVKRHKDIKLHGGRLYLNRVPKEYLEQLYSELVRRTSL